MSFQGEDVEDVVFCVERMGEQIHSLVKAMQDSTSKFRLENKLLALRSRHN